MSVEKLSTKKTKRANRVTSNDIMAVKIKTENNSLGTLKFVITIILLLVQIAALVLSYLYLLSLFNSLIIVAYILSVATTIYVISSDKNSQSKPVWILVLMLIPIFGFIIYFISDDKVSFLGSRKRFKKIFDESEKYKKKETLPVTADQDAKRTAEYFKNIGGFEMYSNTDTTYYSSGTSFFDSVLEEIDKAEKFVFMEYFIISDGVLLWRVLDILERKAKMGVDIRIIYDDLGSHGTLSKKNKAKIKKIGIKLRSFNPLFSRVSAALNYRDHRKIVVVDGKVAFTGGANLADEYTNEKRMHGYWKDAGIMLEGAAVNAFTLAFLRQWEFITKKTVEYEPYFGVSASTKNKFYCIPFVDGLEYKHSVGKGVFETMIAGATRKIYIMTPYFILDDAMISLLKQKALSGVDVRIVIPGVADKKFVYTVSRSSAEKLIEFGVKVYVMDDCFVHSKLLLTESSAVVGSINFDLRSFYQQFESALYLTDKKTMSDIGKDFEKTFAISTQITSKNQKRNNFFYRLWAGILKLISPFM